MRGIFVFLFFIGAPAVVQSQTAPTAPGPPAALTLAQVLDLAHRANPTLLAAAEHLSAVRAQEITAGLRQNPNGIVGGQMLTLDNNSNGPDFINAGVIDASGKSGSGALTLIAITDTTGGGTLETTAFGTIILEDNTVISTGAVSISVDGALSTSSGDTIGTLVG